MSHSGVAFSGTQKMLLVLVLSVLVGGVVYFMRTYAGTTLGLTLGLTSSLSDGLVGHWTFDGRTMDFSSSTEVIVSDVSGNNNDGTSGINTYPKTGALGQALTFVRTDPNDPSKRTCVLAPQSASLDNLSSLSLSLWVRPAIDDFGSYYALMNKGDARASSLFNGWRFRTDNLALGRPVFAVNFSSVDMSVTPDFSLENRSGDWMHLSVTWSGGTASTSVAFYLNGELMPHLGGQDGVGVPETETRGLAIGNYWRDCTSSIDTTDTFPGDIDDVRIYNRALSADEVKRLYDLGNTTRTGLTLGTNTQLENDLVGHWTFDADSVTVDYVDSISVVATSSASFTSSSTWSWTTVVPPTCDRLLVMQANSNMLSVPDPDFVRINGVDATLIDFEQSFNNRYYVSLWELEAEPVPGTTTVEVYETGGVYAFSGVAGTICTRGAEIGTVTTGESAGATSVTRSASVTADDWLLTLIGVNNSGGNLTASTSMTDSVTIDGDIDGGIGWRGPLSAGTQSVGWSWSVSSPFVDILARLDVRPYIAGYSAADRSSQGNTATATRGSLVPGRLGQGVSFDAVRREELSIGNVYNGVRSVAFWIHTASSTQDLMQLNDTTFVHIEDGHASTTGISGPSIYVNSEATSTLPLGQWNHVVITTASGINADAVLVGARELGPHFTGSIDDLRFYARALSGTDIRRLNDLGNTTRIGATLERASGQGLVAHWSFDGQSILDRAVVKNLVATSGSYASFATPQDAEYTTARIRGTNDSDRFGFSVSSGDVNGDTYLDYVVGAYGFSSNTGRVYIFYGPVTGSEINAEDADVIITGETTGDLFGWQVDASGNFNNDAYSDIIVGAYDYLTQQGRAYVFLGSNSLSSSFGAGSADSIITGTATGDYFGVSVANAGDVDNDGYDDMLIGAHQASDTGTDRGRAYLIYGGASLAATLAAASADVVFNGESDTDYLGRVVDSAGDVNNDGYDDLILGAYGDSPGRASIVYGSASLASSINIENANVHMTGLGASDEHGRWVAGIGDVNGDGYSDVAVGSPAYSAGANTGRLYLYFGADPMDTLLTYDEADVTITGGSSGDYFGRSFAGAGDLNGDGYDDLIVGAQGASDVGTSRGTAYVFFGGSGLTGALSAADADVVVRGTNDSDAFGYTVNGGDVTGDGWPDLLVGAYQASDAGTNRGTTHVISPVTAAALDGTLVNAVLSSGAIGQGVELNGTNALIDMRGTTTPTVRSVSFWLRAGDTTSRKILNLNGTAQVELDGTSQITATGWTSPTYYLDGAQGARTIDTDWHHVVVTSSTGIDAGTIELGRVGTGYFLGKLDDVRLYDTVLTRDEVATLYDLGR